MNKCTFCEKPLQPIGNARKNGKMHDDWESRKMHKKCYKIQQANDDMEAMCERLIQIHQKLNF